jgi:hypothetical protein
MFSRVLSVFMLMFVIGSCGRPKRQAFIRGVNALSNGEANYALLYFTSSATTLSVVDNGVVTNASVREQNADHGFEIINGEMVIYGRRGVNKMYVLAPDRVSVSRTEMLPIQNVRTMKEINGELYFWSNKKCAVHRGTIGSFNTYNLTEDLCRSQNATQSKILGVHSMQGQLWGLADQLIINLNDDQQVMKYPNGLRNPFGGLASVDGKEFLLAFSGDWGATGHGVGYFAEDFALKDSLSFAQAPSGIKRVSDTKFIVSNGYNLYLVEIKGGKLSKMLLESNNFYSINAFDVKGNMLIWVEQRRPDRSFGHEIKQMKLNSFETEIIAELNEDVNIFKIKLL